MHCLEVIQKMNEEDPRQSTKSGVFKFNKEAGCLVYYPPGLNNCKKGSLKTIKPVKEKG